MKRLINKIVLGTAQFGMEYGINNVNGQLSKDKVFEIFDFAYESGIRILDTAEKYGIAHNIIAEYHEISTNRFEIISKYSLDNQFNFYESVISNLKKLQIESFHSYLFHKLDTFIDYHKHNKEKLQHLLKNQVINKIGVSVYTNEEIVAALNFEEIGLIQFPYNLFDNINLRADVIRLMKERNIEIHARSIFLQGLIYKNVDQLTGNTKDLAQEIKLAHDISKKFGISVTNLALNYVITNQDIDYVVIGVDNLDQLKTDIKEISSAFDPEIIDEINKIRIQNTNLLIPSNWYP